MTERTIVVLEGDQTGQELLEEALRVLDPAVSRVPLNFMRFDLSLEKRRDTENQIVRNAAAALRDFGLGIKAATITPEKAGDAGSPNQKNIANPLAMILAGAALLRYVGSQDAERASRAIYESALGAIYDGVATSDLGAAPLPAILRMK